MPELPEVEVARRSLRPIAGRRVKSVEVMRPMALRTHKTAAFAAVLRGLTVRGVDRRGKYLLIALDGHVLLFHFKLWGIVRLHAKTFTPEEESGAVVTFSDGSSLEFREMQLSEIHLLRGPADRIPALAELGLDPLDRAFTRERFGGRLAGARGSIKNVLTDQAWLAGIGNLWAHEILHRAGVAPPRGVDSLRPEEIDAIYRAIGSVLREAIRKGGEPEFRDARGRAGRYPLAVYGREGKPCPRDGTPVRAGRLGGRPSFWCPTCQR
ncbi:MAG: Fpg/Nei family DNA glycosylase [Armatimonadetes bacterium]|nr:Fpg/Nei family DNA glycosylase [Armatimonadota bacterium]